MKTIQLSRGLVTVVDDEDFEWLSQWKWSALPASDVLIYAVRQSRGEDGRRHLVSMHREIMGSPCDHIDHADGDGLNNRRSNLRRGSHRENMQNRRKKKGTSSHFKGVYLHRNAGKWAACISDGEIGSVNGHPSWRGPRYLGLFASEIDAAMAYDREARKSFGEFAKTNFQK